MKSASFSTVAILAFTASPGVDSFVVQPSSTACTSKTSLNLLPEQGKQLEAAVNAAYAKAEAERELCELEGLDCPPTATATAVRPKNISHRVESARAFVSRVFHLPSFRDHPVEQRKLNAAARKREKESATVFDWNDQPGDDVVLFPLVGFQFVQDAPNHYGVLPSSTACNPSCRLRNQDGDEEVFGWFSKACHLDLFSDDYCQEPKN